MTRIIDLTSPSQLTDEVMFDLVQHLIRQSNIPRTVDQLDRLCVQTVSGEIEFMDEEEIDELKLSQGGNL